MMIKAEILLKWREFVNKRRNKRSLKYKREYIIRTFKEDMINNPNKIGWRVYYNVEYYDDECETVIQMFEEIFTKKKGYDILLKGMDVNGNCDIYIRMGKIEDPDKISDTDYYSYCIGCFT